MSQIYNAEPAPTGSIRIETNCGNIDINLWCKECPTATRFFLQLIMDDYYTNSVFHRCMDGINHPNQW